MSSEELSNLDALLGGGDTGFSTVNPAVLEAAGEIGKTVFDAGVEAWSVLLGRGVMYTHGDVKYDLPESMVEATGPKVVLTTIHWSGDREGTVTLVMPELGAQGVVAYFMALMSGEETPPEEIALDDDGMDAYGEAVNNLVGSAAQALRQSTGGTVNLSVGEHKQVDFETESPADVLGSDDCLRQMGQVTIEGMGPVNVALLMPLSVTGVESAIPESSRGSDVEDTVNEASSERNKAVVMGLKVPVCVILAEKRVRMETVQTLAPGSIIEFRKLSGELLDVCADQVKFAEGEVVIVNEHFGIQLRRMIPAVSAMAG